MVDYPVGYVSYMRMTSAWFMALTLEPGIEGRVQVSVETNKWVTWNTRWFERWFTCGADRLALRAPDLGRFRETEIQVPWRELAHCSFC